MILKLEGRTDRSGATETSCREDVAVGYDKQPLPTCETGFDEYVFNSRSQKQFIGC